MGYRSNFENLLKGIFESINVKRIDHDARAKQGNKPDFVLYNHDVPVLYIEAKDIGVSLDKVEKSEQMARYYGYANLVLTDYLEFRFYRNGERYGEPIKIGEHEIKSRTIQPLPDQYNLLTKTFLDFTQSHKEPIKSGKHLSKIMGGKAQRIRDNVVQLLTVEPEKTTDIVRVYETVGQLLVQDLSPEAFADMYAQTLVYGLFVARYHDTSPEDFSRQEARDLVPASNPFLAHFFDHIAGRNFEKRLGYIVDELCEVFCHADIKELMVEYFREDLWGDKHEGPDPVIHFYEDFLKEYDPELRKKMGAYYTPLPVVRFIVRAVDRILERDFGLSKGLADTTKDSNGLHKVQVLDPAVGTGTFISAVIAHIYERILKTGQKGSWASYVHNELLPRIHGFELMMAPYTIAHLKLSIAFEKTGVKHFSQRLGIYLSNSLEESGTQPQVLAFDFGASIAEEAKEASKIKNEKPIMVVLGNPPYSVSSSNKGEWILNLIEDYKKDLNERNIQPLSDDYIKFVRFAEHFVEKNQSGIVAMITNNSYLDGIIHRLMRKHLVNTFDEIYILDLHGSAKKNEGMRDGVQDENVFNIQQGVAISIFIRKNQVKTELGRVFHYDLWGKKLDKFTILESSSIENIDWQTISPHEPNYFFVPKDFSDQGDYEKGFRVKDLFLDYSTGIKTHRDGFVVDINENTLRERVGKFKDLKYSDGEIASEFGLKDNRDWNLSQARKMAALESEDDFFQHVLYRPFDIRWIYYSPNLIDFDRKAVMTHIQQGSPALLTCKQQSTFDFQHVFITESLADICSVSMQTKESTYIFPLYKYDELGERTPNLNKEVVKKLEERIGTNSPEDLLNYIYAVLHSRKYRTKYKEFLKIDFPRIPYPKDKEEFSVLARFGKRLQELHLLQISGSHQNIANYDVQQGTDIVEKVTYTDSKVYINKDKYFNNIPSAAWNFYIGGYRPAERWLKDRKGVELNSKDIEYYQKIISALVETDRIMNEIDKVGVI